jgi:hypothetical protein
MLRIRLPTTCAPALPDLPATDQARNCSACPAASSNRSAISSTTTTASARGAQTVGGGRGDRLICRCANGHRAPPAYDPPERGQSLVGLARSVLRIEAKGLRSRATAAAHDTIAQMLYVSGRSTETYLRTVEPSR